MREIAFPRIDFLSKMINIHSPLPIWPPAVRVKHICGRRGRARTCKRFLFLDDCLSIQQESSLETEQNPQSTADLPWNKISSQEDTWLQGWESNPRLGFKVCNDLAF